MKLSVIMDTGFRMAMSRLTSELLKPEDALLACRTRASVESIYADALELAGARSSHHQNAALRESTFNSFMDTLRKSDQDIDVPVYQFNLHASLNSHGCHYLTQDDIGVLRGVGVVS